MGCTLELVGVAVATDVNQILEAAELLEVHPAHPILVAATVGETLLYAALGPSGSLLKHLGDSVNMTIRSMLCEMHWRRAANMHM